MYVAYFAFQFIKSGTGVSLKHDKRRATYPFHMASWAGIHSRLLLAHGLGLHQIIYGHALSIKAINKDNKQIIKLVLCTFKRSLKTRQKTKIFDDTFKIKENLHHSLHL